MIVSLTDELIEKCKAFAVERITGSADLYSYRGESRKDKMIEDVLIGTLGEWAVAMHINSIGYVCSEPDMKIYEKRRKSFSADLLVDEVEIHVKSQGVKSAKRYGNSWLLQRHDKIVTEPKDCEIFAFTNVNLEDKVVHLLGFCWAEDMTYGECKVWSYKKTKVAIYLPEIEDQLVEF